jgi:hypothetical protein
MDRKIGEMYSFPCVCFHDTHKYLINIIMCRYVVPAFLQIGQVLVRVETHFLSKETMASTLPILRNSQLIEAFFYISLIEFYAHGT